MHRHITGDHCANGRAARLSQFKCGVCIAMHEHFFDGHFIRLVNLHQLGNPFKNDSKALRPGLPCYTNAATAHVVRTAAIAFNDAEAGEP